MDGNEGVVGCTLHSAVAWLPCQGCGHRLAESSNEEGVGVVDGVQKLCVAVDG